MPQGMAFFVTDKQFQFSLYHGCELLSFLYTLVCIHSQPIIQWHSHRFPYFTNHFIEIDFMDNSGR